ncbi:DNA internalization-related competence protein ComEC/Rec2 [Niallia sp. FSL W8-0635]|uniref:DNA internalization-related competence protein ComEC/Rec2 n=1 Tax=Niallia sp. FSL W8-0635 TaxID=2975337 RepID=UPI002B0068F2|nr:DNA internalization-related competence protein ComEC/Rec2 [Yersinia enterocolitica]
MFQTRLLYFAVSAFLGILCSYHQHIFFYLLFVLFIGWLFLTKKVTLGLSGILLCAFLLFLVRGGYDSQVNHSRIKEDASSFIITFLEPADIDGDRWRTVGKEKQTKEKLLVSYKIKTEKEKAFLEEARVIGKTCMLQGSLSLPSSQRNENGFNYRKYLENQSIFWLLSIEDIQLTHCKKESDLLFLLKQLREKGTRWIADHFSKTTIPIAEALIFGDRGMMDENLQTAYQRLGIIHLLAISGSHVVVLIGILYFVMIRFGISKERASTILLLLLPVYAVLTGLSPSVVRAVLTAMLLLAKNKLRFLATFPMIDIISIVCCICLFIQPRMLFNIGFLLSFIVCFFLIISSNLIKEYHTSIVKMYFFTTIISEFAVIPVILYYFYEIPTLSLIANLIFIPFYTIIVLPYLMILYVLSFPFPQFLAFFSFPLDYMLMLSDKIVVKLASYSFSTLVLGRPTLAFLCAYIVSLPFFFYLYENIPNKSRKWLYSIPILLISLQFINNVYTSKGEITFIDVGQGDSILIHLPNNKGTYLIDTGGTVTFPMEEWQKRKEPFEVGAKTVVPFLKSKGIYTIDKLILTHGDLDHIGGSTAIIEQLQVKEIMYPNVNGERSIEEERLITLAKHKQIPIRYTQAGQKWTAGHDSFFVLAPLENEDLTKNNGSIVIFAKIADITWLFTGDLEKEGEQAIMHKYPLLKEIDILKIGHHGSKTSSSIEFIERLNPKIAVISVGENNRYNHPSNEVLTTLNENKVKVFRTDKNGGISFYFSKKGSTLHLQIP